MFYERFIQLCDENSEKPTNVLKLIGVSSGNLKNWKNGTSVKSDILMQLSEHFNVSVDYLLGRTDTPNSKESINNQNTTINNSVQAVKSPVTIGKDATEIQFDEMTAELVKAFQGMNFVDKMEIMNAVLEKTKMKGNK